MKGFKTYTAAFLAMFWGAVGCFKIIPQEVWQGVSLALVGLCFIFSRWALRNSWSGAYKVYVKEKPDGTKSFSKAATLIRGE